MNFSKISFAKINIQKLPISKILLVAMTIIAILAIKSCSMKTLEVTSSGVKIEMYKAQATVFGTTVNKLGETVTTQLAVITNKDRIMQELLGKNSTLSKLNSQMALSRNTNITNVGAPYIYIPEKDSIYFAKDKIVEAKTSKEWDCLPIGTKFDRKTPWYFLSGSIQKTEILFDSISVKDSITYNLGTKKPKGLFGFLKPYDPTVEIISSNPFVKVKTIQNITFISPKKWYENKGLWFLSGVISAGIGTYYLTH